MKKIMTICIVVGLLIIANSTIAAPTYVETLDIYEYTVGPDTIDWAHTYDHSVDPMVSATLTIVADDVDLGEVDKVYVKVGSDTYYLGSLQDMGYYSNWSYEPGPGNTNQPLTTTVFALDTSWINGLPVEVLVDTNWGVEIETSTLTIVGVPAPGAILLGSIGVGLVGWLRRKRAL